MTVDVVELEIPQTWDEQSEAGRRFREMVDLRNAVNVHEWDGDTSHDITYREAHGTASNQDDERIVYLVAIVDDRIVGRSVIELSRNEALHIGVVDVLVHPDARRRRVGTALWQRASQILADDGRTTIQSWVDHRPAPGPVLAAPTGFGSVPAEAAPAAFALRAGFTLEQIERMSELRLASAGDLDALLADAREHAAGYELVTWTGSTPPERLEGLARLHQRMSTDVPAADLDHEEEVWDVDRLARYERTEADRGREILRAIAVHPTAGVVAFTTLVLADPARPVYQHDTLVHAEHRGHRLGMLVKIANLLALRERVPEATVLTWNAEENRPMLRVNEAIGFTPIGYEGAWQLQR